VAREILSFVGPCEIARADRRVQFGAFLFRLVPVFPLFYFFLLPVKICFFPFCIIFLKPPGNTVYVSSLYSTFAQFFLLFFIVAIKLFSFLTFILNVCIIYILGYYYGPANAPGAGEGGARGICHALPQSGRYRQ
jgi:hypothetical protein